MSKRARRRATKTGRRSQPIRDPFAAWREWIDHPFDEGHWLWPRVAPSLRNGPILCVTGGLTLALALLALATRVAGRMASDAGLGAAPARGGAPRDGEMLAAAQ